MTQAEEIAELTQDILKHCCYRSSYELMEYALRNLRALRRAYPKFVCREVIPKVLGHIWSRCDGRNYSPMEIQRLLTYCGTTQFAMTAEAMERFQTLPERVTVYRGADKGVNEAGISWTLEESVARRFPFYRRYRSDNPVLLTGQIHKNKITALILDRDEAEVVVLFGGVKILSCEPISEPADMAALK